MDMKGIAVMHALAAIAAARSGATPSREIIVVAVADEEAGGHEGAGWLLEEHEDDVGFGRRPAPVVIGEGAYGLTGLLEAVVMPVALGEKQTVWVDLKAVGDPGHGSLPPARQALTNLARALIEVAGSGTPRVHPVLREQFAILAQHAPGARGRVFKALSSRAADRVARLAHAKLRAAGPIGGLVADTVTPTQLAAGYKHNVVPGEASASLDCRLLPDTDVDGFIEGLRAKAARHDVEVSVRSRYGGPVSEQGALFQVLADASRRAVPGCVVTPSLTIAMTDIRYFRARGATGYGWVPLALTPELLGTIHGHDERIPVDAFERAVEAMTQVVMTAIAGAVMPG